MLWKPNLKDRRKYATIPSTKNMKSILLRKMGESLLNILYQPKVLYLPRSKQTWKKLQAYRISSCMASESCLGFIFSAPARLSAADCFTIEIISLRNTSCINLSKKISFLHSVPQMGRRGFKNRKDCTTHVHKATLRINKNNPISICLTQLHANQQAHLEFKKHEFQAMLVLIPGKSASPFGVLE